MLLDLFQSITSYLFDPPPAPESHDSSSTSSSDDPTTLPPRPPRRTLKPLDPTGTKYLLGSPALRARTRASPYSFTTQTAEDIPCPAVPLTGRRGSEGNWTCPHCVMLRWEVEQMKDHLKELTLDVRESYRGEERVAMVGLTNGVRCSRSSGREKRLLWAPKKGHNAAFRRPTPSPAQAGPGLCWCPPSLPPSPTRPRPHHPRHTLRLSVSSSSSSSSEESDFASPAMMPSPCSSSETIVQEDTDTNSEWEEEYVCSLLLVGRDEDDSDPIAVERHQ